MPGNAEPPPFVRDEAARAAAVLIDFSTLLPGYLAQLEKSGTFLAVRLFLTKKEIGQLQARADETVEVTEDLATGAILLRGPAHVVSALLADIRFLPSADYAYNGPIEVHLALLDSDGENTANLTSHVLPAQDGAKAQAVAIHSSGSSYTIPYSIFDMAPNAASATHRLPQAEETAWNKTGPLLPADIAAASAPDGSSASDLSSRAEAVLFVPKPVSPPPTVETPPAVPSVTAPVLREAMADVTLDISRPFLLDLDAYFAGSRAGGALVYRITLEDGRPLPGWIYYDPDAHTLTGTPPAGTAGGRLTVVVTASDANGTVSDDFTLTLPRNDAPSGSSSSSGAPPSNHAPSVNAPIGNQVLSEDAPLSFVIPPGSFADSDGDTLTYTATLDNGGPLPAWLSFDPMTDTLSGTPVNADVGVITIRITADDGHGGTVYDDFTLTVTNVNDAPTVSASLADQAATEGAAFSYQFAAGSFADIDAGDMLGYSAALVGGGALPLWLVFDASTRTFSGTPTGGSAGTLSIRLTASDGHGGSVSDDFDIIIASSNAAPTVANPIADQAVTAYSYFNYAFPSNSFSDADGDALTYSAALAGGGALPGWLRFDAATRTLYGAPVNADAGSLTVRITADDGHGHTVHDDVVVTVSANGSATGGSSGNDNMGGTGGADVLDGLAGNDTLSGNNGNDALFGGDGADNISGGQNDDSLYGGADNDSLYGQWGNDVHYGDGGDDYVEGGDGNDVLYGGDGLDTLNGGNDNDAMYGENGNDSLIGAWGTDSIYGGAGNDTIDGGDGNDLIDGGDDNDSIFGSWGADTIYGGQGSDTIDDGDGTDTVYGGDGNDLITITGGGSQVTGGLGQDTIAANSGNNMSRAFYNSVAESAFGTEDLWTSFAGYGSGMRIDLSALPGFTSFADFDVFVFDGTTTLLHDTDTGFALRFQGNQLATLDGNDFIF